RASVESMRSLRRLLLQRPPSPVLRLDMSNSFSVPEVLLERKPFRSGHPNHRAFLPLLLSLLPLLPLLLCLPRSRLFRLRPRQRQASPFRQSDHNGNIRGTAHLRQTQKSHTDAHRVAAK
ncbi:putative transmembrane protein, partial [Toxoplasma gondii RUB]